MKRPEEGKRTFKPPRDGVIFAKMWNRLVKIITERENFLEHHLSQLEILCGLYQEMEKLEKFIDLEGHTYTSEGRNGTQIKAYPEVGQLNRVRAEIRNYSIILGLTIAKARGPEGDGKGNNADDEWDE